MPQVEINGAVIHYRDIGRGAPIVLTPGGRWGGDVQHVVADALARDFRVITWDRRNCDGASSFSFGGDASEADLWADDLAALIRSLGAGPCFVGEYAGCRTAPLLAFKHPELVKGLMLAWPSGGEEAATRLPRNFYRQYIRAALRQGMAAVAGVDRFAKSIELTPSNRDVLTAMTPLKFARQMSYWEAFFNTSGDLPIAGCRLSEAEWRAIDVPAIVTGGIDPIHPTATAQTLARLLPRCDYHEPVVTDAEWNGLFGVFPYPVVSDLQGERIAPVWRDFIRRCEG